MTAAGPPSPAVAPPPGQPRFALFDALRGLAVLAVLTFHVAIPTGALDGSVGGDALQALGPLGLNVFFGVSGFLLYRPFAAARAAGRSAPRLSRYLRRRALRILPAYWAALTLLAVFPGIVGVFGGDWWRFYGFLQVYSLRTFGAGIPQAWTLCVEVSFYLALPLWAWLVGRVRRPGAEVAALAVVSCGGLAVQALASQQTLPYVVGQTLLGQVTCFAVGMVLAVWSVLSGPAGGAGHAPAGAGGSGARTIALVVRRPGASWAVAAAAFCGLVALVPDGGLFAEVVVQTGVVATVPQAVARTLASMLFVAALLLPAVVGEGAGGWPRRVLAWRPLTALGVVSYGVYLYHLTLSELLATDRDPAHYRADAGLGLADALPLPTLTLTLLTLAASVAVAAVSYRVVELPFLRLKERAPAD